MKTIFFNFKQGYVSPQNFSGRITYEWFNILGAKHLIIHTVRFDQVLQDNVENLVDPTYYKYLVERAKEACKFT